MVTLRRVIDSLQTGRMMVEQCDVGKSGSANPPDRQTLGISRSQMPSSQKGLGTNCRKQTQHPCPSSVIALFI